MIQLHLLDADKYANWYYNLCLSIYLFDETEHKRNRYLIASYRLHARHVLDEKNTRSLLLSKEFSDRAESLSKQISITKTYMDKYVESMFYLPEIADWQMINFLRDNALQFDIDNYETGKEKSMLPEIEYAKTTLQKVENEKRPDWLEHAQSGMPIPKGNNITTLAHGLAMIDYAKYLHQVIEGLEHGTTSDQRKTKNEKIMWNGTQRDFSELVKALALTVFTGTAETEIIRRLAPLIEITPQGRAKSSVFNSDRHSININDLQDEKPKDMFTAKMNKAIEDYLRQKHSDNE